MISSWFPLRTFPRLTYMVRRSNCVKAQQDIELHGYFSTKVALPEVVRAAQIGLIRRRSRAGVGLQQIKGEETPWPSRSAR